MKIDMSPEAVKGRLKLVSQLWRLSLALGAAKQKTDARRKFLPKPEREMREFDRRPHSGDKD